MSKFEIFFVWQLRTPFNYLLINLSVTELVISMFGNSVLAYNSFHQGTSSFRASPGGEPSQTINVISGWAFSSSACQANAFGMTFLGEAEPSL